jgi:hypothetical protein
MYKAVLLDTSFFLRFLNDDSPLFNNADGYFRYFLRNEIRMCISTISIAEYCVGGDIDELPLKNLQIIPFNFDHSKKAGEFTKFTFQNKNKLQFRERNIIPNDTKLFATADVEKSVEFYLSSDTESYKIYRSLKEDLNPKFQFIDLNVPLGQTFGVLDL